ncbi:MAG: TIGR03745 family integrating conjugative element membrane protein [Salinicola sp.]|uniref:TIGR03745 family integrating conjugative element membrane protein n=1 Tax=uncultured Salinicola sp. TaxID=1193542 RepID=UPI000C901D75|nr:TIGR03745 family integrating conjugative element membrane protein [uncultured Salinicola sp.]MAM55821.1 TIGR03745 family integrating conjugative element membrane protein [Salinicola sp.]
MQLRSALMKPVQWANQGARRLVVAFSVATTLPSLAWAQGLPELEEPTQGGGGIRSTAQGYLYDFAILGGLIVATVAFLFVAISAIAAFREAQARGEWSKFGITFCAGVILILAVIWLGTEAGPILSQ